jgi:predicted nucleotidyltransferase
MTQSGTATLKAQLKPFCEHLKRLYEEPVVVLCGSTAIGENMPWSDIDLIVVADFEKPFLDRLGELALLNDTGLSLEVLGYTPAEFMQMLDNLNPGAIEAVEFGIPILPGRVLSELKEKLAELKKLGVTKTPCTYLLAKRPVDDHNTASAGSCL